LLARLLKLRLSARSLADGASPGHLSRMAQYELRLFMSNGCGSALLGEVAVIEARDGDAAMSQARQRVRALPKRCFGSLYDQAGAEIWTEESPGPPAR
jgi:hypothetical protein